MSFRLGNVTCMWTLLCAAWFFHNRANAQEVLTKERATVRQLPPGKGGSLRSFSFSPDGTLVAITVNDAVKVWKVATLEHVATLGDFRFGPAHAAFSPDGKALATTGFKEPARLYDAKTWQLRHKLGFAEVSTRCVAFSPDGKTLAVVGFDNEVAFWDTSTGKKQRTFAPGLQHLQRVAFSPDGKTLAVSGLDDAILWDVTKDKARTTLKGHDGLVHRLAFSSDGKSLVTADTKSAKVTVWDVATGKPKLELDPDKTMVRDIGGAVLSPDGKTLAIAGFSLYVHLWDVDKGVEWGRLAMTEFAQIDSLAFSPDGSIIVAGCGDGAVRIWDMPKKPGKKK
jgi:WD40 repeat protein